MIKPGRDWAGHVPGQYVRVGVDVDGVRLWRTYSLTHGPRPDRCISITVKAHPRRRGLQPPRAPRVRPGQMVQLEQAEGEFVLPDPIPRKLLLVTAGSGITPVIGMLRNLFSRRPCPCAADIVLVHVSADPRPTRSSATSCARTPRPAASGWSSGTTTRHGMLDVAHLDELVPDLAERHDYACGPAGLLDALEEHHAERGLPLHHRAVPPRRRRDRRGRHGHLRRRHRRRGRRRHPDPRRRRRGRRPDAQRLPDGHLHGLRAPAEVEGAVRDLRNGALTVAAPGDGRRRRSRPASAPPPAPATSTTDLTSTSSTAEKPRSDP